ncbi:N-acetyltransferase family protein [Paenibacillus humicus]|uniref:GNAT family N-acetyltransferase n=1 Tax=Paenibacillus humicus TaxID=412861 RepID=UPI003D29AE8C
MNNNGNQSEEPLSQYIEDNFLEVLEYLHSFQKTSSWYNEVDVTRIESEVNSIWYNAVIFKQEITDKRVSEIYEIYKNKKNKTAWFIFDHKQPEKLNNQLFSYGFKPIAKMAGMAIDLNLLSKDWTPPKDMSIRKAVTEADFEEWYNLALNSYPMSRPTAELFLEAAKQNVNSSSPKMAAYLIQYSGHSVGIAEAYFGEHHVGLYSIATLQQVRKKGIGTAATMFLLMEAYHRGYRIAVLQATEKGIHLYERIGFQKHCNLSILMSTAYKNK